ncbi:oligosaccharide flippase family protein, partial [Patescibacteria group bacterium]|nr:oligosaccharide flippase family protein [Patescibacteria group bacterium]
MNLLKIQSMSFLSRFGTMLVGNVFQSLLVIALLSQEEYGMVAIVASLVSIIGASQSFGLTSGSTRELSSAKTKEDAKAIFLTSLILRFLMSFPFAVLLFLQADNLSLKSSNPDIIAFAIKITALVMFFEPLRGVFNSVISSYHQ